MRISMIMAMDSSKLIGKQGGMPWKISSDMKYFKRVTMGKPLIMGRVTYDSLGRPLPGRSNIVLTRDENWHEDGVESVQTLEQAFTAARKHDDADEMMVIGGSSLCKIALPFTQRLYLTVIDHQFSGDTWLDSFSWDDWIESSTESHDETEHGGYRFTYYVLQRRVFNA